MQSYLAKPIYDEYERWMKQIGDSDPYLSATTVGITDVLRSHFMLVDHFFKEQEGLGGVGPKSLTLLHSTLGRQLTEYRGVTKWENQYEVCATLFYGIIKNHPFHDGNKRTALLTSLYHLQKLGRWPQVKQKMLENLAVDVAEGSLKKYPGFNTNKIQKSEDPEIQFIANFFKKNTKEINKRKYLVTYFELNVLLNRHDYELLNPHKNYIDVIKVHRRKKYILFGNELIKREKVTTIGFPGWKREASSEDVLKARKAAFLMPENGVDSDAFFHGTDSLSSLISIYQGPLERLANR